MARLVLIDTSDELPGLLGVHAWSALAAADLIVVADPLHPLLPWLQDLDVDVEVLPADEDAAAKALSRADLLSGLTPAEKRRAELVVDRAREAGEVAYVFGSSDTDASTRALGMEAARAGLEVEVVYFALAPRGSKLLRLVDVMGRLRGPDGCPWDHEQTHSSLARYAVEEVHELLDAIAAGDDESLREELGDVLLQVVFHAQVAADERRFDIDEVADGISDKLVRRHPHVFSTTIVSGADEVVSNWEQIKAAEKPERTGPFDGVAAGQPALGFALALQARAAKQGFEWPTKDDAAERVRAELEELLAAEDDAARHAEVGDLLLAVVGVARTANVDPELALRASAQRFRTRVEHVLQRAPAPLRELSVSAVLDLWEQAKVTEQ